MPSKRTKDERETIIREVLDACEAKGEGTVKEILRDSGLDYTPKDISPYLLQLGDAG